MQGLGISQDLKASSSSQCCFSLDGFALVRFFWWSGRFQRDEDVILVKLELSDGRLDVI